MSGSPSLAGRAMLAVVLMAGFYLLALTVSAILLWVPFAEYQLLHRVHPKLFLVCALGAGVILWSIVPRPDRFEAPGPRLEPERHPLLFAELESIAGATRQAMPAEVFLVPDVNAWVAGRGGVMGFGSRRVMGLGLPLLQMLSVSEMRAVLAHEFGHYHAGDTRLGPWVHKTRMTLGRTLRGLEHHSGLLQKPFAWYGAVFLRVSHAVSRAQEFAADALAARVAGAPALQSGLRRIHGAAAAFGPYWESEVLPVLQAGFRPPLADGFSRFTARASIAGAMAASVEEAMRESRTDPFDTHPPLAERIAAVEGMGEGSTTRDARPAVSLLADVGGAERELLESLRSEVAPEQQLEPLGWDEVGPRVVLPAWEDVVRRTAGPLATVLVDRLPDTAAQPAAFASTLPELDPSLSDEDRGKAGEWILGVALGVALVHTGWTLRSLPGEPVTVSRGAEEIDPLAAVRSLAKEGAGDDDWAGRIARWGIAGRSLADAPG